MAEFGFGAKLGIGGFTFTEVTNISGPAYSADTSDVTTHDNANRYRTFIKGLLDAGEVSADVFYKYDNMNTVTTLISTTTLQTVTITLPSSPSTTKFECQGMVTGAEVSAPMDDLLGLAITIKLSGQPVYSKV